MTLWRGVFSKLEYLILNHRCSQIARKVSPLAERVGFSQQQTVAVRQILALRALAPWLSGLSHY